MAEQVSAVAVAAAVAMAAVAMKKGRENHTDSKKMVASHAMAVSVQVKEDHTSPMVTNPIATSLTVINQKAAARAKAEKEKKPFHVKAARHAGEQASNRIKP